MASRRAARGYWRAVCALVVGLAATALQSHARQTAAPAVEQRAAPTAEQGVSPAAPRNAPATQPGEPASEDPAATCIGKARLRGLGFEKNGSSLADDAGVILDLVAEAIRKRCAGKRIVIEGHTDVYGDPDYNRRLSERRAEAVKAYLVQRGVPPDQLRVEGHGEDNPLTTDPSADAQALNRRVTLRVDLGGA